MAVVVINEKTAKNGKPQVTIIADEIAVKDLEKVMDSNASMPKETNIFANLPYARYSKLLQLAASFFDLDEV